MRGNTWDYREETTLNSVFKIPKKKKKKPPNLQYSSTSVFLSTHYKTSSNGGSSNCHNFEAFMSINVTVRYL